MNNEFLVNKVESEIADWNSKEDRLKNLFKSSPSIGNSLLKEKLRFYESILIKYRNTDSLSERTALQVVKTERNSLINEVYSGSFKPFLYKVLSLFILERINARKQINGEFRNNRLVSDSLETAGFKDAYPRAERYMKLGQDRFIVPVSYYHNENEQLKNSLDFVKNENGYYDFKGYKSVLHNQDNNFESRHFYFDNDGSKIINCIDAFELLSGRAIFKDGIWKQLDFNDKADGGYLLKEFPETYGYSVEKNLSELPIKMSDQSEMKCIIDSLKEGRKVGLIIIKEEFEQKIFIEANPQKKCLNLYNENLRKVTLETLFKIKNNVIGPLPPNIKKQNSKVRSKSRKI